MPRARASRCVFKEGGRRCPRDGHGDPPLCRPHHIAVAEESRKAAEPKPPMSALFSLFDDFLAGRTIRREKVAQAIDEAVWGIGGGFGANHDIFEDADDAEPRQTHVPPWGSRQTPPPPPPSEHAQKAAAIRAAKAELEFGDYTHLTAEIVNRRRRELARKHHPDLGGSVEKMQRINNAAEILLASL